MTGRVIHTASVWLAATIITDESRLSPALIAGSFPFAFGLIDNALARFLAQWLGSASVTCVLGLWLIIGAISVKSAYRANLTTGALTFILAVFFQTTAAYFLDATGLVALTDSLISTDIRTMLAAR